MQKEEILRELERAIINYDAEGARKAMEKALNAGVEPIVALEEGAAKGIRVVGEKFEKGEVFLPHLVMAAAAMEEVVKVLKSTLPEEKLTSRRKKVLIGTVKSDIHDIGKNIVAAMLRAGGFEVYDIGKDVPTELFVEKAKEFGADIIACSALMSVTRPFQRDVIEELKKQGLRGRFKVMVGGGAVSADWAKEIGADGYGKDAVEAVHVAKKILGEGQSEGIRQ